MRASSEYSIGQRMKNRTKVAICFWISVAVVLLFGCTKKAGESKPQKETPPVVVKKDHMNLQARRATPELPSVVKRRHGAWQSFQSSLSELEKYDSSDASCRTYCRQWCPKAVRCNVEMIRRPQGCKRYCYAPCRRGQVPKVLAECLIRTKTCPDVKACFTSLPTSSTESGAEEVQPKSSIEIQK